MQPNQTTRMELHHNKSRFGYKNMYRFSSQIAILPHASAQCKLLRSPSNRYPKITHGRVNSVITKMIKLGGRIDILVQGIREHVKLGPKLSETIKGKFSLGARILQVGGVVKVFKQKFNVIDDEKLLNTSQCYLSTTAGPIARLLFVSSSRVAFCSERSIKLSSPTGKGLKGHYKVMIPLRKIKKAIETENVEKPRQKYVKIVTEDNFEFWLMGFLNHETTLKYLQQVIHQTR